MCNDYIFRIKRKFLVSIIEGIQRSKIPDDPDNMLKIKACIYIDALIAYFKQVNRVRQNQTVKLDPLSEITTKLNPLIRKKFSQPNTFRTYVFHSKRVHTKYIISTSIYITGRRPIMLFTKLRTISSCYHCWCRIDMKWTFSTLLKRLESPKPLCSK